MRKRKAGKRKDQFEGWRVETEMGERNLKLDYKIQTEHVKKQVHKDDLNYTDKFGWMTKGNKRREVDLRESRTGTRELEGKTRPRGKIQL